MHQNGKEDYSTGSASEANAFGSNTFPLLSRSSMKRPFSLSSEREHQTPNIRDHFRSCRGFRLRSKTIHADTFTRTSSQYCDLIGSGNTFFGVSGGHHIGDHRSTTIKGLFESNRNRKNTTHGNLSSDTQHLVIPESILLDDEEEEEEMAVDDSEEEPMDGQLTMLLDSEQDLPSPPLESKGKPQQQQKISSLFRPLDTLKGKNGADKAQYHQPVSKNTTTTTAATNCLTLNPNPAAALCASSKSKGNHNVPPARDSLGSRLKLAITFAPKPTANCDEVASNFVFASKSGPNSPDVVGQLDTSPKGPVLRPAIQSSLSPLAVPKSAASSLLDSKASTFTSATAHIPTEAEKAQFQRSLDSATTLVFHRRTGLPLTSSPAPIRKYGTCFDFDSSLTSVNAIKKALFENDTRDSVASLRSRISFSSPTTTSALLGNFEESVLNGRLEPASVVNGFTAEIGASGTFCPSHKTLPVTVFFYALQDSDKGEKISSPYLGHINLGPKGYHVPRQGTVQVTLFNPNGTVVKMFVVRYNLSDMPPNSRTFLRQRTLFMPSDANEHHADNRKWLRYLIHLRFQSSKSGRIRLHTDIRILVFRKHDLDVATLNGGVPYELRSFIQMPSNPKYSKNIKS